MIKPVKNFPPSSIANSNAENIAEGNSMTPQADNIDANNSLNNPMMPQAQTTDGTQTPGQTQGQTQVSNPPQPVTRVKTKSGAIQDGSYGMNVSDSQNVYFNKQG